MSTDVEKQDDFVANEVDDKTELLESNEKCMGFVFPQVNLNSWNPENQKQWEVSSKKDIFIEIWKYLW